MVRLHVLQTLKHKLSILGWDGHPDLVTPKPQAFLPTPHGLTVFSGASVSPRATQNKWIQVDPTVKTTVDVQSPWAYETETAGTCPKTSLVVDTSHINFKVGTVGSPGRPEKAQRFAQQPRQLGPLRMVLLPLLSDGVKPQKMRPIRFRIRRSAQMGPTQSLHRLGNRGLTPGGLAIIPDGPNFVLHFRPRLVGIRPSLGGDLVQHFADERKPGSLLNMAQNGCPHLIHSCIRFAGSITS